MTTLLSVKELVLCATNEGSIYQSNLAAARYSETSFPDDCAGNRESFWRRHLRAVVCPALAGPSGAYKGETLRFEGGDGPAAVALADYYADHLSEM